MPPPGLPRPADDAVGAGAGAAARAAAPVLRAAPTCAAGARSTPTGSAWAGTAGAGDPRRYRSAAPALVGRGVRRPGPGRPRGGRARRGALGHRRHAGHRGGGGAVRRGPLAVQPQRRGPRLAVVGGGARRRRCRSPTCSPSTPPPTRRCCGRWCATACARARTAADALADVVARGRRRRAGLAAEPAAHRRRDGLGHRLGPRAVRARRARARSSSPPNRSTPIPAGPGSPTDTSWWPAPASTDVPLTRRLRGVIDRVRRRARHPPHRPRRRGRAGRATSGRA